MIVSTNFELLAKIPVFAQLPLSAQKRLMASAMVIDCQPKQRLFAQDERLTGLYGLIEGHIKLYRESGERIQILALLEPGDCFGTEALSDDVHSSYSAATMSETKILFVPAQQMQSLLDSNPEFRVALLQVATARLRQFAALVHNLAFRDVTARLATILVALADSEGIDTHEGLRIPRLMSQGELASMVGTAREVVYRTLKKFENMKLIQMSREQILILDLDTLREIAAEESR